MAPLGIQNQLKNASGKGKGNKILITSHRITCAAVSFLALISTLHVFWGTKQLKAFDDGKRFNSELHEVPKPTKGTQTFSSASGSLLHTQTIQQYKEYELPPCDEVPKAAYWMECKPQNATVDVVLNVYKRNSLSIQLDMLTKSIFPVSNVWIVQNGDHMDVPPIIEAWKHKHADEPNLFEIHHIHYHTNSLFHGRYHVAYQMSKAKYISLFDDDMEIGPGYIGYVVDFMESQEGDVYVGSAGFKLASMVDVTNDDSDYVYHHISKHGTVMHVAEGDPPAKVDYAIQSYHLRRQLIRHLLAAPVYTYVTGEDMQLAYALQKQGIPAYVLAANGTTTYARDSKKMGSRSKGAASHSRQEPRNWLICKLALEGFQYQRCRNCANLEYASNCTKYFESGETW